MTNVCKALAAAVVLTLAASGTAIATPEPFDAKAQGERYRAFLKEWSTNVYAAQSDEPKGEPLPFAAGGILTVKPGTKKATRLPVNRAKFLANVDRAPADLGKILWAVDNAFSLRFVECVPRACFIEIFTEYSEPGFWMSLADSPAGPILDGVVYYRKLPADRSQDARYKVWAAALEPKADGK